uniref:G-protein coupled receptors family 1 profile domain-containing protein n=1 Tax=Strongyloides stercoralis TaxID=6248 RepID=A0A0K0EHJ2_STRER
MYSRNSKHYFNVFCLLIKFIFSRKCSRHFLQAAFINFLILHYLAHFNTVKYDLFHGVRELCLHDSDCKEQYYVKIKLFPGITLSICVLITRLCLTTVVIINVVKLIKDFNRMINNIKSIIIKVGILVCIESVEWMIRIKLVSNLHSMHISRDPINYQYYKMALEGISSLFLLFMIFNIYLIERKIIKNNIYEVAESKIDDSKIRRSENNKNDDEKSKSLIRNIEITN